MPTVREIENALFELAPKELAESYDNVGLLAGACEKEVHKVLIALDITEEVVREAVRGECELIVSHHPVMNCAWKPVQTIRDDDTQGRLLMELIRTGTAAICMHTNLDAAQGGVNDVLATRLGLEDVELLGDEHGIARMGVLPTPMGLMDFLALVRKRLRPNGVRYVGENAKIGRVAVGGGSCGDFYGLCVDKGCDAFVTADVSYHKFLDAAGMGLALIDAGHFPTEDVICPVLEQFLSNKFPTLTVSKSASHREVVHYYI